MQLSLDNSKLEEIKNICYKNLEETSVPYEYRFVTELPINVGGKIDGLKLKREPRLGESSNVISFLPLKVRRR